jgi:hypothetical protein
MKSAILVKKIRRLGGSFPLSYKLRKSAESILSSSVRSWMEYGLEERWRSGCAIFDLDLNLGRLSGGCHCGRENDV